MTSREVCAARQKPHFCPIAGTPPAHVASVGHYVRACLAYVPAVLFRCCALLRLAPISLLHCAEHAGDIYASYRPGACFGLWLPPALPSKSTPVVACIPIGRTGYPPAAIRRLALRSLRGTADAWGSTAPFCSLCLRRLPLLRGLCHDSRQCAICAHRLQRRACSSGGGAPASSSTPAPRSGSDVMEGGQSGPLRRGLLRPASKLSGYAHFDGRPESASHPGPAMIPQSCVPWPLLLACR